MKSILTNIKNLNINNNILAIILYLCGIVGILVFFLFVILALRKKTRASSILSIFMLILSIGLLGSGTYFKIKYDKQNPPANVVKDTNSIQSLQQTNEKKEASIDNLKFKYNLSSFDNNTQHANMTIKNSSNSVFNGQVKVNFLDSSRQLVESMDLSIKNLVPKKSYSPDALVSSSVTTIEYEFKGTFSEKDIEDIPYSISKISTGNKFVRINVSVSDTSKNHLEQICNELALENSSTNCNGLLVYFYPENKGSTKLNFDDLIADYYLNNISKTSSFTYYK